MSKREICDIYDIYGNKTGRTFIRGCPLRAGEYVMIVNVWIVNSKDQILIQKRSSQKKDMPNIWATHSGCLKAGETSVQACVREAAEEIGINIQTQYMQKLNRKVSGKILSENFIVQQDFALENAILQEEEVSEVRWVTQEEIKKMFDERIFYQYPELNDVFHFLQQRAKRRKH